MIRSARSSAFLLALPLALPLFAGCTETVFDTARPVTPAGTALTGAIPERTGMEGAWSSNDGVFIATFDAGVFTSRFVKTNEILAKGTYSVTGNTVRLEWMSVRTQQGRAATCAMVSASTVSCQQDDGGRFDLNRA